MTLEASSLASIPKNGPKFDEDLEDWLTCMFQEMETRFCVVGVRLTIGAQRLSYCVRVTRTSCRSQARAAAGCLDNRRAAGGVRTAGWVGRRFLPDINACVLSVEVSDDGIVGKGGGESRRFKPAGIVDNGLSPKRRSAGQRRRQQQKNATNWPAHISPTQPRTI